MTLRKGGTALMAAMLVAGGASAKVELLGQPCRAKNVLSSIVATSPKDGTEYLIMQNMNEDSGAELLFVDYRKNTGHLVHAPAGSGGWALAEVPGHRIVAGTFFDGKFMVYDLAKADWAKVIDFPGETYIWNFATGKDGRLYGGTYPGGKLGALNLDTYEMEDCGAPAPPNQYLRFISATPDGRIFCPFGMEKPVNYIYDPATRQFTKAREDLQSVGRAATWNGYFFADDRVFEGPDLTPVKDLPFPMPKGVKAWAVNPILTTRDRLVFSSGRRLYSYRAGEKEATLLGDFNLHGGGYVAVSPEGDALALRGPDYAWVRPGDKTVEWKPIPVESGPRPTMFLSLDGRGRLWGGPTFGQTLFWLDPKTKEYHNTGKVSNAGGEVYDMVFIGNVGYAVSYVGGEVIRYDTDAPFDQIGGKNPKTIAKVGPKYVRPAARASVGPDGRIYAGWWADYGTYGGAVTITDPKTNENVLIENPLGAQSVNGIASNGTDLYIGTSLGANGMRNKPDELPKFGVMDAKSRKVSFVHEFPNATTVSNVHWDPGVNRVGMAVSYEGGARVEIFDPAAKSLVPGLRQSPPVTSATCAAPGDGFYYFGSGDRVVALDLKTGEAGTVEQVPGKIEHIAASKDGALYVSVGVDVYRVREARKR